MDYSKVETGSIMLLIIGAALAIIIPIIVAVIWKVKKKESFATILTGAVTFVLFALILEKPIQNVLLFPTQMGLQENSISAFVGARPLLLAVLTALFPGVFEETGRFLAFKTVLKNKKNKETAISYGIGHGGIEVIIILGLTYAGYVSYAFMMNAGIFDMVVNQVAAQAPDQIDALNTLADQISGLTVRDFLQGYGAAAAERVFSVLFHIGASILVFYACRDKGRFWLYPLAILLHTGLDFIAGLYVFKIISIPGWLLEGMVAVIGIFLFAVTKISLYNRDVDLSIKNTEGEGNEEKEVS